MGELKLIIQPDVDEVGAAEVLVDGWIGDRPYRFLLDTGAAKTSVLPDDYLATFDSADQDASSGVFAAHREDLITVPNITVGSITRQNFTLTRASQNHPGIRSLIGMDLLKDYVCHFVFEDNRVLVDADDANAPGYAWQDLFLDKRFHPYVEVQFGTAKAHAVWDTGSSITVVDTNFIDNHPALFQTAGQSTGTDSTGASVETPMFLMAECTIGGSIFPAQRVAGVDLAMVNATLEMPMDLILGYPTLSKANWIFDFPHRRWAISKRLSQP
jgi:predicted aspartyl protease